MNYSSERLTEVDTTIVVDTNILIYNPEVLDRPNIKIPFVVLQELDKLKTDERIGFEARRAIRAIKEKDPNIDIEFSSERYSNNDDLILECALKNNAGLLTKDISLTNKAKSRGVLVSDPYDDHENTYKGVKTAILSEAAMADMYQNPYDNVFDLCQNQYLIVKNDSGITVDKLKWSKDKMVQIKLPPSKVVKPLNDLQACALDLLNDKDIPIKILAGTYGSGKTLLNIRMALYHVMQRGTYSKIMLVRNPIGSGQEIGFIKGDKDTKIEPFYKPIEQNLEGGEFQLRQMLISKQLEFEIPYYIKGQSLAYTWTLVDEAEDLDKKLIKLIGTRLAEGSCITFSGDWKQAEPKYARDNGLIYLLNQTKNNPLTGAVVLDDDVRSDASKVFAELD